MAAVFTSQVLPGREEYIPSRISMNGRRPVGILAGIRTNNYLIGFSNSRISMTLAKHRSREQGRVDIGQ